MAYCLGNERDLYRKPQIDKDMLKSFAESMEPFIDRNDLQLRSEGNIFNIYCADKILFDQLCNKLKDFVRKIYEPGSDNELSYMIDNRAKKVLCNHIPFNRFNYKVFIKTGTPLGTREKFKTWIMKYKTAQIPKNVEKWLSSGTAWGVMPFVYVEDSATLSMIGLFLGNHVLRIEQFIPRSSINIPIMQEEPCQV
jgi:hypothetical protein